MFSFSATVMKSRRSCITAKEDAQKEKINLYPKHPLCLFETANLPVESVTLVERGEGVFDHRE
jgi:hypothetical protein